MAGDNAAMDSVILSGWHSIRPWTPPLSLSVREITSVSATFILSASLQDLSADGDPSLASLGITEDDSNEDDDGGEEEGSSESQEPKRPSAVAAALAGGLKVEVDGSSWRKVFIRIDDKVDEAVIIIYGLLPCRQYDIDLELVQGGQKNNIRRQVVTEEMEQHLPEEDLEEDSALFDHANSSDPQLSTPSTSPGHTMPNTPPIQHPAPGFAPLTLEDRLNQLQHALSLITAERDNLTASLKSARKDSQKADAALRSEIEILKRASDKHTGSEHRAKQKVLALQEAVKRAQTSTNDMEKEVAEVQESLPGVKAQREEKEKAYKKLKAQADRAHSEKDAEEMKQRKRMDAMKGEISGLTNKLDRLTAKKEKLEASTIPDLEQRLRDIEQEISQVEMDPYGYYPDSHLDMAEEMDLTPSERDRVDPTTDQHYLPFQRGRLSLPTNTNARPPPQQSRPPQPYYPRQGQHSQRASSMQFTQPPILLTNPNRQSSLKSPPAAVAVTSTLSSRAAPFEPGRPLRSSAPAYTSATLPTNIRGSRNQKWTQ